MHWKLANEYFKTCSRLAKPDSIGFIMKEESSIKDLYEEIRLKIRALYRENKDLHGCLSAENMDSYEILVENIPEYIHMNTNHKATEETAENEICTAWFQLKSKIDWNIKKVLGEEFKFRAVCVCSLKDLSPDEIYGNWNGCVWRCQDEKKPHGYL